jgi:hypothetical protein
MDISPKDIAELRWLAKAESDVAWQFGDLALRLIPMGAPGSHNNSEAEIQQLATLADLSWMVLDRRRDVAAAFPPHTRIPRVSWSAHREATYCDDPQGVLLHLVSQWDHGGPSVTVAVVRDEIGRRRRPHDRRYSAAAPAPAFEMRLLYKITRMGSDLAATHIDVVKIMGTAEYALLLREGLLDLQDVLEKIIRDVGIDQSDQTE